MRKSRTLLIAGAASTAVLLSLSAAAPALAATEVVITDRETVQIYMTPTGKVKVARVYDQITATGQGQVDIENPVSTDGLRNLEGLSGVDVEDGNAVASLTVDGEKRLRTVSTFDGELPVTITPKYTLDGKVYEDPEDIVGKSGELTVLYRVENITGELTTLTVKDGKGNDVQRQVEVPMPLAGQLVTLLPKEFYAAQSDQATVSADGRGGTRMTFTMTLLPPVGSAVAEVGYTAQVKDAVIPRATVTIAVVQPLKNPSLSTAAASYQGGATTGATLTAGAEEIDANLLKLRDGAGELLGGLLLLRDGAEELNAGLAGEAAPGANRLADGAGEAAVGADALAAGLKTAATGSGDLAGGLGELADGNKKLANGFNSPTGDADLVSGSQDLAAGLGLISGGLATLAGVEGLPKAYAGLVALKGAVDGLVIPAIGTTSGPCDPVDRTKQTLLGCMQQIVAGVNQLGTSATAGLPALRSGVTAASRGLNGDPASANPQVQAGIRGGVSLVQGGLGTALAPGGDIDQLATAIKGSGDCGGNCQFYVDQLLNSATDPTAPFPAGTRSLRQKVTDANNGLLAVLGAIGAANSTSSSTLNGGLNLIGGGLDQAIATVTGQLLPGVTGVRNGLATLRGGLTNADANGGTSNANCNPSVATGATGYCGLTEGLTQLVAGLTTAVGGVTQLSTGAATAATGSGTLAEKIAEAGDGAKQLAEGSDDAEVGSKKLADGLVDARDGSARLADGNSQISTGAGDLAAGLDTAADGSGQLADGLGQAADGAPALVDGAQRLSDEGTKKLVEAGNETALDFGERYAILAAMAEMTKDGGLPYGPPEGAIGSAAYSFELAAATHESSRNLTRGLLAIVALGLGALLSTVIRARFF